MMLTGIVNNESEITYGLICSQGSFYTPLGMGGEGLGEWEGIGDGESEKEGRKEGNRGRKGEVKGVEAKEGREREGTPKGWFTPQMFEILKNTLPAVQLRYLLYTWVAAVGFF